MIAALLPLALLAAQPAPTPAAGPTLPSDSLVVFGREPVCHMGRTQADGTRVRLEYHPLDDSYHLLVGGPSVASLTADATPMVMVRSGFDRHFFRGSMIAGNPDMPASLYVPLSVPLRIPGSEQIMWLRNVAIEHRLFDSRGLQLLIDDKPVAAFTAPVSVKAARELIKCSDRFVPKAPSLAAARIARRQSK